MKHWFEQLGSRERWIVIAGGLLTLLVLYWALVLDPLSAARTNADRQLMKANSELGKIQQISTRVNEIRTTQGGRKRVSGSLLGIVDRSIRSAGMRDEVKRLTPDGSNRVRLWFDSVRFDNLITLFADLQEQAGISVDQLSVSRLQDAGYVRASVTLLR